MPPPKSVLTPEVEAMLQKELHNIISGVPTPSGPFPLVSGFKYHPKKYMAKKKEGVLSQLKDMTQAQRQLLQAKLNWLLIGYRLAHKLNAIQWQRKTRNLLRKEGYYISQHGTEDVNFAHPKWGIISNPKEK